MKSAPARPSPVVSPARQPRREALLRSAIALAVAVALGVLGLVAGEQRGARPAAIDDAQDAAQTAGVAASAQPASAPTPQPTAPASAVSAAVQFAPVAAAPAASAESRSAPAGGQIVVAQPVAADPARTEAGAPAGMAPASSAVAPAASAGPDTAADGVVLPQAALRPGGPGYRIQLGVFGDAGNALKLYEQVAAQGYAGARWPKMTSPDGRESPSSIGVFLVWQQPHPIYYAELLYRLDPKQETLARYRDLVFATADFMADFARCDDAACVLGPPLIPAQEIHPPERTLDPSFELAYWRFGLETAQTWRERLGLGRERKWDRVLARLSPCCGDCCIEGPRDHCAGGLEVAVTRHNEIGSFWQRPKPFGK